MLEKTLESPLECKKIQPVHLQGNQSWILEGLMLRLKLQYFGHLMQRTDSSEKILMLGKIEGGRRKGTTEDEMVGWHHWLSGHEFEQTQGNSGIQRNLECCSPWDRKESDMTEQLNNNNHILTIKKKWNNAISSYMDGLRDYHTKWYKSEKDIIWYHLYAESKTLYKWMYLQNRNRPVDIENKLMVTKGERWEE